MLQNKKNVNLIFGHVLLLLQPSYPSCIEKQQHLNKVNNRIHVKITYRVFYPSLLVNNKTTVTYVMMQTTQKDSFFLNNWFINELYGGNETSLIRTQAVKFWKKFDHFKKRLHLNKKNILSFSFFKSSMWNYLPVHRYIVTLKNFHLFSHPRATWIFPKL